MLPGSGRWSGHRHPPHTGGPRPVADQLELGVVGVLELVDQDVGEPFAVAAEDGRAFVKEPHGLVDHIIEVEQVFGPFVFLVGPVDFEQVFQLFQVFPFFNGKFLGLLCGEICIQFIRADQLIAECTDPVNDRLDDLDGIVAHLDVLKPEGVDIFESPDQLGLPGR